MTYTAHEPLPGVPFIVPGAVRSAVSGTVAALSAIDTDLRVLISANVILY